MHRKNWPVHSSNFLLSCSTQGEFWVNLLELGWLEELEDHETFSLFIRPEATLILKQRSGSCSVSIHWHFSWQPILNKNRHPYLSERLCSDYFSPTMSVPSLSPCSSFLTPFLSVSFFVIPLFVLSDSLFDSPSEMWESQRNPKTQRY